MQYILLPFDPSEPEPAEPESAELPEPEEPTERIPAADLIRMRYLSRPGVTIREMPAVKVRS